MEGMDVHLAAYDLLEISLDAEDLAAAVASMRLDLEVLPREDLVLVALALSWESARVLVPRADRPRFRDRLERRRLNVMVGPL